MKADERSAWWEAARCTPLCIYQRPTAAVKIVKCLQIHSHLSSVITCKDWSATAVYVCMGARRRAFTHAACPTYISLSMFGACGKALVLHVFSVEEVSSQQIYSSSGSSRHMCLLIMLLHVYTDVQRIRNGNQDEVLSAALLCSLNPNRCWWRSKPKEPCQANAPNHQLSSTVAQSVCVCVQDISQQDWCGSKCCICWKYQIVSTHGKMYGKYHDPWTRYWSCIDVHFEFMLGILLKQIVHNGFTWRKHSSLTSGGAVFPFKDLIFWPFLKVFGSIQLWWYQAKKKNRSPSSKQSFPPSPESSWGIPRLEELNRFSRCAAGLRLVLLLVGHALKASSGGHPGDILIWSENHLDRFLSTWRSSRSGLSPPLDVWATEETHFSHLYQLSH